MSNATKAKLHIRLTKLQSTPIPGTKYFWAYAMYGDNQLHAFSAGVMNVMLYADLYPVWLLQSPTATKPLREFRYPREAIQYARKLTVQNSAQTMKERLQCLKQKKK